MNSNTPGHILAATIGHGSQPENASMPFASSATVMSGGGVFHQRDVLRLQAGFLEGSKDIEMVDGTE